MITRLVLAVALACAVAIPGFAAENHQVDDDVIARQRAALAAQTDGAGYGPQAPRDLSSDGGSNPRVFDAAPAHTEMNLCNIHFHEGAEHKGGEFTTYAGNGDGEGYGSGYLYDGTFTEAELAPVGHRIGDMGHGDLEPGDTIEAHFVYSTAQVEPGPTLGSCLSEAIQNPQLRVEAVVMALVNDPAAADFNDLAEVGTENGFYQAVNLPNDLGDPVQYAGSTTGPKYNQMGSPFQVSWSVRPKVLKVDINSVEKWLSGNVFDEDHAHGVRNLVINPALLSPFK